MRPEPRSVSSPRAAAPPAALDDPRAPSSRPANYGRAGAPGRRADPRSWMLLILTANIGVFLATGTVSALITAAVSIAALAYAGARRGALAWGAVVAACLVLWLAVPPLVNATLPPAGAERSLAAAITENVVGAVALLASMLVRFGAVGATGGAFLAATRVSALTAALGRLRVPRVIIIPLAVTFRFLPVVRAEYANIADAMRMRGIQPGARALVFHPARTVTHILIPLVSATLRAADDLAASALIRGLGATSHPTSVQDLRFRRADVPLFVAAAVLVVASLLDVMGLVP